MVQSASKYYALIFIQFNSSLILLYDPKRGKLVGEWDGDAGQGDAYCIDGTKYIGRWYKYLRHGSGTLYSEDGQLIVDGKWDKGRYVGSEYY